VNEGGTVSLANYTYDGQTRLAKTVLPEGNSVEYEYDDAPCAAQQRCTHNVKALRQVAKPGSGLATLTQGFTYEGSFNKVATSTDPRAKVTSYTYTAYTAAGFPAFYLQTSVSQKTSAANTVLSTTAYNAANQYVPQTVVADAGSGKLNFTSTLTFDAVGNPTVVNGPRTDVTDMGTTVYDGVRRSVQRKSAPHLAGVAHQALVGVCTVDGWNCMCCVLPIKKPPRRAVF